MIRVRVDDFPQTRGEPQHTLDSFREFHKILSDGIGYKRYLLGVIPGRCSVNDILFLRNEVDAVVGMHGTDHDETRLDRNGGNQFESWLTSAGIANTLVEHRIALEIGIGREVSIYMPPRNVIDFRTTNILRNARFEQFTTGPETDLVVRTQNILSELNSVKPHEYGRSDEMFQMGSHEVLTNSEKKDIILTLHWTWECNIGFQHLAKFLSMIPKEKFKDFDD
jgi:hypothetical protein